MSPVFARDRQAFPRSRMCWRVGGSVQTRARYIALIVMAFVGYGHAHWVDFFSFGSSFSFDPRGEISRHLTPVTLATRFAVDDPQVHPVTHLPQADTVLVPQDGKTGVYVYCNVLRLRG